MSLIAQEKFCIAKDGKAATIIVDENDWKGVIRAARDLGDDVRKVTGTAAEVIENNSLTSHLYICRNDWEEQVHRPAHQAEEA